MKICVVLMMAALCFGCVSRGKPQLMSGKMLKRELSSGIPGQADISGKVFSLSANNMTMRDFCSWLSRESGLGIVFGRELDGLLVSLDFRNASLAEVMLMFSRRYGVSAVRSGNTYFVGTSRATDKFIFIRTIRGYSVEDIRSVVGLFSVESSRSVVMSSGVVVCVVDNDSLVKTVSAFDVLVANSPRAYMCRVFLLRRRADLSLSSGVGFVPEGEITAFLSTLSGRVGLKGTPALSMDAVLGEVEAEWRFVAYCGRSVNVSSGSELRVSRRDISQYGYSTTAGADIIQCGLSLNFTIYEGARGGLVADYSIVDRRLDSWRDGYPQTYSQNFKGVSAVSCGGVSLIGDFTVRERSAGIQSFLVPFLGYSHSKYLVVVAVAEYPGFS